MHSCILRGRALPFTIRTGGNLSLLVIRTRESNEETISSKPGGSSQILSIVRRDSRPPSPHIAPGPGTLARPRNCTTDRSRANTGFGPDHSPPEHISQSVRWRDVHHPDANKFGFYPAPPPTHPGTTPPRCRGRFHAGPPRAPSEHPPGSTEPFRTDPPPAYLRPQKPSRSHGIWPATSA